MVIEIIKQGNVEVLQIQLPISKRASKTGKSDIIAGTGGFQTSSVQYDGKPIKVSVNAII